MTKDRRSLFGRFRSALVGLTLAAGLVLCATGSAEAQTVTTPKGTFPAVTLQGVSGSNITKFLGVRFAAAPTGALRFAPPVAPAAVSGTVQATSFGSPCPQSASPFGSASTNEDCLFLNVYVPSSSVSARNNMPVMVFWFGGDFVDGQGSIYDPTQLAIQGNTIVVTINYRLGILGYLADTSLTNQAADGVSGNYGFLDQLFSLKWVKQNIGAFGGNPNNVTIFGESAGGFSVCGAVVSPAASGLFQRAITESGPCGVPFPTLAGAEASGAPIVSALNCADATDAATVSCLRNLSVSQILSEQNVVTSQASLASLAAFFPNVDGKFIPMEGIEAIALGEFNQVPIIEGTNHDEGRLFVALAFDLNPAVGTITAADYAPAVEAIAETLVTESAGLLSTSSTNGSTASSSTTAKQVQTLTNEILNEYPLSNFSGPGVALGTVLTDGIFACTANITDELFSLNVPTFAYELNDENIPTPVVPAVSFPYGATHTDELQLLFNLGTSAEFPLSTNEQKMAATFQNYFTSFAADGNPNSAQTVHFPFFTIATDAVQSIIPPTPQPEFNLAKNHNCNFWISILEQTILDAIVDELESDGITN
jgi:para-nitrobenzyl esterase